MEEMSTLKWWIQRAEILAIISLANKLNSDNVVQWRSKKIVSYFAHPIFLTVHFAGGPLEPVEKLLRVVCGVALAVSGQAKDSQTGSLEFLLELRDLGQIFHVTFFWIRHDAFEAVLCPFFREPRGELFSRAKQKLDSWVSSFSLVRMWMTRKEILTQSVIRKTRPADVWSFSFWTRSLSPQIPRRRRGE